jgi:hypothetical protein
VDPTSFQKLPQKPKKCAVERNCAPHYALCWQKLRASKRGADGKHWVCYYFVGALEFQAQQIIGPLRFFFFSETLQNSWYPLFRLS